MTIRFWRIIKSVLFVLVLCLMHPSISQDFDIQNLDKIDVDNLSDEKILKFLQEVEKRGLTEDQLIILARSRGMSSYQISKLQQRIRAVSFGRNESETATNIKSDRLRTEPVTKSNQNVNSLFENLATEKSLDVADGPQIFGFNLFTNPKLTFSPSLNIPTPKNYVLGAGDEIFIDVWGASEQNYQLTVSPEGRIIIPRVGPIYINGYTVESAKRKILGRLKQIYAGLDSNTFAEVSLGQTRTIQVSLIGEVKSPGTYTMSGFATAMNALYYCNGPNENGSLRQIDIFRNGKLFATLDIYELLVGSGYEDIYLRDQDLIIVRPYLNRVTISGEVKNPGIFEIVPGESLGTILGYAGGVTSNAFINNIMVRRNDGDNKTISTIIKSEIDTFQIQGGDEIFISNIRQEYKNRVQIEGAVVRGGEYQLEENMDLKSLIKITGGLTGDAFMDRSLVIRMNPDYSLTNYTLSLRDIMSGDEKFILQSNDYIKIQSIRDLRETYYITIEGEVNSPGRLPYIENMVAEDVILMADGFKESAAKSIVEIARRVNANEIDINRSSEIHVLSITSDLKLTEDNSDFKMKPFDFIVVRKNPFHEEQQVVEIEGEVNFPGKYVLEHKNDKISDLLRRAGGLTGGAYPRGAQLIRRTEYYVDDNGDTKEGAKIRRQELELLLDRDTLVDQTQSEIKRTESVGIDLEKILLNPKSEYDIQLNHGDIISIPKELQTVRIRGEVLYPSNIRFVKNANLRNYIGYAGGLTEYARIKRAYVIYPNGTAEKTKRFLWIKSFPKVEAGSEIIIPRKPERRRLSPGEIISITTGIGTLAVIINNLTQ